MNVLEKEEVPMAHFIFNAAVSGIAVLLGRLKGRLSRRPEDPSMYTKRYTGPEPEVLCQLMDQMKDTMRMNRTSTFHHEMLATKLRTRNAYFTCHGDVLPSPADCYLAVLPWLSWLGLLGCRCVAGLPGLGWAGVPPSDFENPMLCSRCYLSVENER